MKKPIFSLCLLQFSSQLLGVMPAKSLPPPEDIPEEVLRTEIITEARSPIDGKQLTAAEYAQLQNALQTRPAATSQVNPKLRELVFLLRVRRLLRTFGVPTPK
ncbi:hypothetical protein [Coleofasciculus sp. FACHB-1120]|uniref:hypothetical protein n=1 Tax=Coleofasciculus sp. FACHB-1120 TaxID=2692783 RepID=UPI0016849421|nr:hypothetical protein [Coleofasciculus sp. FACHB-1120]MBD2741155.1 hypothetical protein [Coleofasciculus sp. FACHB-1120]